MMTRKDFIAMAETLRKVSNVKVRESMCEDLCVKFSQSNPRFNVSKFKAACEVHAG